MKKVIRVICSLYLLFTVGFFLYMTIRSYNSYVPDSLHNLSLVIAALAMVCGIVNFALKPKP